jgi:hypothetical protein
MNTRERFKAVMNFEPFDRMPVIEWAGWWDKTIERWHSEGAPSLNGRELMRYFDLDIHYQEWFRPRGASFPKPLSHGAGLIETPDDYTKIKNHLYPEPDFQNPKWKTWKDKQEKGEAAIWITLEGFFWFPRTLFGIEGHLFSFYDQAELYHDICSDLAEHHINILDKLSKICTPDFMTFAEDMSYNNGPMISKELFDEFMKPYYKKIIPRLKEMGTRVFIDSDGDISTPAEWFEDAGIEGILPLEKQAGVDLVSLRKKHPNQLYIGGFDKMTMSKGEKAMREEFERLLPVAKQGGFIISCDHQTPPEVSLENYRIYVKLLKEYAVAAARS